MQPMTDRGAAELPGVFFDRTGAMTRADEPARELLKNASGTYRVHKAGTVLVMVHDDGTGAAGKAGEELALAGDINTMPLLGLMNQLGQNRETGRLVVADSGIERVVLLKNGDVASVGSNQPRDRLGAFLQRIGKVTAADLDRANALAQSHGARIGQALVQLQLLEPHELWACIQEQITELFSDICQWTKGSFVLYRVPPKHPFPSTPPLTMQALLLESVRRADEMSVFRERIPNVDTRVRRTNKPAQPGMDPEEQRAHTIIASPISVAELARTMAINEFEATRLCYQLLKSGLIEIVKKALPPLQIELSQENKQRIYLYNLAFREIRDEVSRHGKLPEFFDAVKKFLGDKNGSYRDLFRGVPLDDNGTLQEATFSLNLAAQQGLGHEPGALMTEALNELTFFMLFQCGELLDAKNDENLGRRVRLIHASLPAASR